MAAAQRTLRRKTRSVPPSCQQLAAMHSTRLDLETCRPNPTSAFSPHTRLSSGSAKLGSRKSQTAAYSLCYKPRPDAVARDDSGLDPDRLAPRPRRLQPARPARSISSSSCAILREASRLEPDPRAGPAVDLARVCREGIRRRGRVSDQARRRRGRASTRIVQKL